MPLEAELRALMTVNVGWELPTGAIDVQGKPVYGAKVLYPCYAEEKPHFVRDQNTGNQVMSSALVFVDPTSRDGTQSLVYPSLRSRLTLPSGRVTTVLSLGTLRDMVGVHHYEVYVI
jgi:hypothetical protein